MRVEIWSDIACPWCYVGKRNLEAALGDFAHRDDVEVVWRSFELDPQAPREREGSYADLIGAKYGRSAEQAQQMIDQMTERGREAGADLRFDRVRPGSTFDAHRLLHLARSRGLGDAMKERLMLAYHSEGVLVSDLHELQRLGEEVGLDASDVTAVVTGEAYTEDVRAEEEAAHDLGVGGVPFFVVDRRYALSGAQPPELVLQALEKAWDDAHPTLQTVTADGSATQGPGCEGDSCAL